PAAFEDARAPGAAPGASSPTLRRGDTASPDPDRRVRCDSRPGSPGPDSRPATLTVLVAIASTPPARPGRGWSLPRQPASSSNGLLLPVPVIVEPFVCRWMDNGTGTVQPKCDLSRPNDQRRLELLLLWCPACRSTSSWAARSRMR